MLYEQLQAEQITALRAKETLKLQTIREIISKVKNKEIDKGGPLADVEVLEVIKKIKKELVESVESFQKGGRNDLIEEANKQLVIVNSYLPAELTDEVLKSEITALLEKNKDLIAKNQKASIGICMKELRSKADSARIMAVLKQLLPV
ncbi:MAG: GatB/YqeY domain-containing protein [Microgenomates group bacterium]